jgi:5-methylcytosine-specific restriction endonuclease McrA
MTIFVTLFYLLIPPSHGSLCTFDDPDYDEARYEEEIPHCRRNVSTARKKRICLRDGGITDRSDFTVDHIIPLSLGGSNHDDNLWCQHRSLAVTDVEYESYLLLRNGELTQEEAIGMVLEEKFNR